MLEIYNEQVFDLLNFNQHQPRSLPVRHSPKTGFFVEDLSLRLCEDIDDMYKLLSLGVRNRRVASHKLNVRYEPCVAAPVFTCSHTLAHCRSSRGHCMLTMHIDCHPPNDGTPTYGRLTFVDLAGSGKSSVYLEVGYRACGWPQL